MAAKYGLSKSYVGDKCRAEKWTELRKKAADRARAASVRKTAEAAADNATIAAKLKKNLLLRLAKIEAAYPFDATEVRRRQGNSVVVYRIRDLTAAYKDLTEDLQTASNGNELLRSLLELERRTGQ